MTMPDVTIYGAGIFGLSVAWACLQRGANVSVVDPHGVATGASGGIVGALAPHVPEQWNAKKAFQLESLLMAEDWWQNVFEVSGQSPGYARDGRIQPIADENQLTLAYARTDGAKALWQARAEWRVTRSPGTFAPYSPTGYYVIDTLSARIHPRKACKALATAIIRRGGKISANASVASGYEIWATGWRGLTELNDHHHRLVGAGIKGQAILLKHAAAGAPQIFADGIHIIPHADGTTAVGSTTERDFSAETTTDDQCNALLISAQKWVPSLADAPQIFRWAGVRPRSRSRAPMLGHHPFRKKAYIANGGFKIGFGMAPLASEKMADLVLENRNSIPPEFAPEASL